MSGDDLDAMLDDALDQFDEQEVQHEKHKEEMAQQLLVEQEEAQRRSQQPDGGGLGGLASLLGGAGGGAPGAADLAGLAGGLPPELLQALAGAGGGGGGGGAAGLPGGGDPNNPEFDNQLLGMIQHLLGSLKEEAKNDPNSISGDELNNMQKLVDQCSLLSKEVNEKTEGANTTTSTTTSTNRGDNKSNNTTTSSSSCKEEGEDTKEKKGEGGGGEPNLSPEEVEKMQKMLQEHLASFQKESEKAMGTGTGGGKSGDHQSQQPQQQPSEEQMMAFFQMLRAAAQQEEQAKAAATATATATASGSGGGPNTASTNSSNPANNSKPNSSSRSTTTNSTSSAGANHDTASSTAAAAAAAAPPTQQEVEAIQSVMQHMMNHDSIAAPFKMLSSVYPRWLIKHKSSYSGADVSRFEKQISKLKEVCVILESPEFADATKGAGKNSSNEDEAADRFAQVVEELQQLGSPPVSLDEMIADVGENSEEGGDSSSVSVAKKEEKKE